MDGFLPLPQHHLPLLRQFQRGDKGCGPIRLWIFRHRHLAAKRLITTLAIAVDTAGDRHRDIVLAELSMEPTVPAPPIRMATRDRPPPRRRSRGE